MFERSSLLFVAVLMSSTLFTQAHFPEYCAECEQEVWEQVPCSEVSTTISPPITDPASSSTTSTPPTTVVPTTVPIFPTTTTLAPDTPTTQPSSYKKCYCECKLGCKEFCRKVISSGPKQPLTQISAIGEFAPGGQVEYTHVHQRKYFPKYGGEGYGPVGGPKVYKPYPLVYEQAAAASSSSNPAVANIAAPNYTLEELAQLLSSAYGSKKGYPAGVPSQPRPQIQLQPAPYYSPVPVYTKQSVPLVSKVAPAPSISYAASAVSSSSGGSVAKIKTPYEEKIVVATPSTIYDRTTSYPIIEEPKAYAAPQTENYPVVQSQTELPVYPSPTESYPSHKESYPSITEAYPSQTEAYQPRTENYPVPVPQPEVKPYGGPESGPDKPSSTFDLAIDNYLKDFGYGNQGRGYVDY
ncbi:nascent polypeptide-associated complex subunit alpha, muscle-specific form [Drosophila elegans]|uniref:nascent polypeptide-associated complex subunit alpha, muscle-specific form n=1 Tax=Drosophila elegans TaxID=30023 RepID=UPI0007E7CEB9|nr:nascent polypeptide-associated complex subunit alpha, muscle-specific form [Drosophila elegans]